MKVLWISHLLPYPPVGGARIRSYFLLRELSKRHSIRFVGLYQKSHQPTREDVRGGVSKLKEFCYKVDIFPFESFRGRASWLALVLKSLVSKESYKVKWCKSKFLRRKIKEIMETEHIELVHFDTISLAQYVEYIPQGIPIIINHHNIESHMLMRRAKNEKCPLLKPFFTIESGKILKLEKTVCPRSLNLVVSELDSQRLANIAPTARMSIIPNGVDVTYFSPLPVKHIDNSLVFVGGLKWYPNRKAVRYFCEKIWPKLVAKEKDAKFFVAGRNPPAWLKAFERKYPNVRLLGFVPDIRPIMSSASGFVCPMWDGGGTRLKILNALAMGVPLIATRMACEGIPVEENKNVLFAESPDEFVQQILRVFGNKELRDRMSRESIRLIQENYSYEKIGKRLVAAYEMWARQETVNKECNGQEKMDTKF